MVPQTDSEQRLEAGPLPRKRGEIGFVDGVHDQLNLQPPPTAVLLSPRHPADRYSDVEAQITSPTTNIPITPVVPQTSTANAPDTPNTAAKKSKCLPTLGGVGLITWSIFGLQVLFVGGTIGAWVLAAHALNKNNSNSGANSNIGGSTLVIFLHTIFTVALLVQLVFVERSIYRIRAERYSYLHPGEILPSVRIRGRLPAPFIAFAPWNRPPLPTYAAALAQSGVGTGDVEDHLIAAPPPPAYGNTRGSRLLLQGHIRDSLRAQVQRPDSALSYINVVPPGEPDPMSYEQFVQALRDGQTQQSSEQEAARDDADRDRRRDETLAQLQSSAPSSASVDQHDHQR